MIHVAVAVIVQYEQVLIALRKPEQHQGNLWEFPGGKVELGETVEIALKREIKEELSIEIEKALPFLQVKHEYADKTVLLDVWWVDAFSGTPNGQEGQLIKWCHFSELYLQRFPAANDPIIDAIKQTIDRQK
jgi:8-oxo-dGTP diphosphatase